MTGHSALRGASGAAREARREAGRRAAAALRRHGVLPGPMSLRGPDVALPEASGAAPATRRLAAALVELGPAACAFGRYVGGLVDLLPTSDALALLALPEHGAALDPETLAEALASSGVPRAAFAAFEERPYRVAPLHQAHRALLADGTPVLVRVATDEPATTDALLEALRPAFEGRHAALRLTFDDVLADFRRQVLDPQRDLRLVADGLERLREAADEHTGVVVPPVLRLLSGPGVLTVEAPTGLDLRAALDDEVLPKPAEGRDTARRLALACLRLAVAGTAFPVDFEIESLRDGGIAFTWALVAELPAESRPRLWSYLRAVAGFRPDRAVEALRGELVARREALDIDLRERIRKVVPFRDGSFTATGETVAEYVVCHLRAAHLAGYGPTAALRSFVQGLTQTAWVCHRLAPVDGPADDALADAVDALGWIAGADQIRRLAMPSETAALASELGDLMVDLPQRLDLALDLMESREGLDRGEARRGGPAKSRAAPAAALLLAMGAVTWITHTAGNGAPGWLEPAAALVFLLLGAAFVALFASA